LVTLKRSLLSFSVLYVDQVLGYGYPGQNRTAAAPGPMIHSTPTSTSQQYELQEEPDRDRSGNNDDDEKPAVCQRGQKYRSSEFEPGIRNLISFLRNDRIP
jgi:hypothetical protein